MSKRPALRRLAFALSFLLCVGVLAGVPIATVVATSQAANAAVASGDIVYDGIDSSNNSVIAKRNGSNGSVTTLIDASQSPSQPSISPDGSRIAYIGMPTGYSGIFVANSDGSGITTIRLASPQNNFGDLNLRWSPDGNWIVFAEFTPQVGSTLTEIKKIRVDGSGVTTLATGHAPGEGTVENPSWSPDGTKIVFDSDRDMPGYGNTQLYIMNADGSNQRRITTEVDSYNDSNPVWSPNGSRIYFSSNWHDISYFSSSDSFATTSVTRSNLSSEPGYHVDELPQVSANGNTIYFASNNTSSGYEDVFTISSSGGATTNLTANSGHVWSWFSVVPAAYPAAPPTNTTATFSAPSSSDAYGVRQVTVNLSATGNQRFDLGWSTTSTTAPNTSYLQQITSMTTKKGPINFLGKYSGTGTTWNGGTQPDQDWYLWVRPVSTAGVAGAWSANKLKVHTPKAGIWAGVGDSYSSGHHLDVDQPFCDQDLGCDPIGYTLNDPAFSWVTKAAASFNSNLHIPTAWKITPDVIAISGKPTTEFGASGASPGSTAWAGQNQAGQLSVALYGRYNSWNIMSMTGGANDKTDGQKNFKDILADWYATLPGINLTPWGVPVGQQNNCPDTEALWQNLQTASLNGVITANLQGLVTVAKNASPGVRVLNVGYPYSVDTGTQLTGNPCYADWFDGASTHHGVKSVVDALNADHTAVTGTNVKYVSTTTAFGSTRVDQPTNGYIQLTRFYGYPHPTAAGQTVIATTAATLATGTGW